MISTQTALILFAIVAVLFGARKLPEIGKGVGEAIKNFKKGISDEEKSSATTTKEEPVASIEKKDQKPG
jgi:sec-independent protein translocase protein TatA